MLNLTTSHRRIPLSDAMVSMIARFGSNNELTNGDAAGPSRTASSSSVNGSFGMIIERKGMSSEMTTGNPIAAGNH